MATAPSRTMSRLQPRVATDWKILLRPGVGEGRNTVLRRGRCANPLSKAVQDRFDASVGIGGCGIVPADVRLEIAEKFGEMAGDATDRWKLVQR